MDREAGAVKAEMPSYQLLIFLALVIPGEKGKKKNESFPLKNKFPLERLYTELGKAGKWSVECVTLSPASAVLLTFLVECVACRAGTPACRGSPPGPSSPSAESLKGRQLSASNLVSCGSLDFVSFLPSPPTGPSPLFFSPPLLGSGKIQVGCTGPWDLG